jgi:hypothetical protein
MNLLIGKKGKKLEEISIGDFLSFPDRAEKVVGINLQFKEVYTENIPVDISKYNLDFSVKKQKKVYELKSDEITSDSKGRIYDLVRINSAERQEIRKDSRDFFWAIETETWGGWK